MSFVSALTDISTRHLLQHGTTKNTPQAFRKCSEYLRLMCLCRNIEPLVKTKTGIKKRNVFVCANTNQMLGSCSKLHSGNKKLNSN
ncbi:TPA: hypothetical protein GDO54_018649 [Pyxicephalus adspersus]|uniref:Uncharacterized protein n=1 Tax=Pyxicephalus adspersus TaxID=30357 RepID=A0AAV2ZJ31_PYXAD|nr:TPA: hypothetical protein GDO54_018649 [Pyxicephalus adspersus]